MREDTATRRLRALSPKDITMSENIEDLKARLAQAEAAAKAAEAEAARAKAEALRAQLEAAGTSVAPSPEPQEAASPTLAMQESAAQGDVTQPGPASSPAPASDLSPFAAHIQAAYSWDVPAVTVGTLIDEGVRVPGVSAAMPLPMFNRHLLVAGATGTGKTRTLQLLAEGLSAGGSSVLLCDVKGDLTGLAEPGASSDKLLSRTAANGQQWAASAFPVELLSLGGADAQFPGVPVRAEVSDFGPILLARALSLNTTQEQALQLIFAWADSQGLELVDLPDLRSVISFLTSEDGKDELAGIGGVSKATAGVILRALTALESQGGGQFFGAPGFDTADLIRSDSSGRGIISLLGVGVVFVTQTPKDIPSDVLAQLGSRIQHGLRASTPEDFKKLKATVQTFPKTSLELDEVLTTLGTGEAVVTVLDPKGNPTPVTPVGIWAPASVMGPASSDTVARINQSSIIMGRYRDAVNPDSAEEKLARRAEEAVAAREEAIAQEAAAKEAERAAREAEKAAAKEQAAREKEMEKLRRQVEKQQEKEEAARQRAAERRTRQVESVLGSMLRTAGREITRSIFGTRKR